MKYALLHDNGICEIIEGVCFGDALGTRSIDNCMWCREERLSDYVWDENKREWRKLTEFQQLAKKVIPEGIMLGFIRAHGRPNSVRVVIPDFENRMVEDVTLIVANAAGVKCGGKGYISRPGGGHCPCQDIADRLAVALGKQTWPYYIV